MLVKDILILLYVLFNNLYIQDIFINIIPIVLFGFSIDKAVIRASLYFSIASSSVIISGYILGFHLDVIFFKRLNLFGNPLF